MPAPTPAYVKNMMHRSLREIVDPSPTKEDEKRIWKFFDCKCAYCGKSLRKLQKEGHIDHLFPASLGGPNHISNRVLSCATCKKLIIYGSQDDIVTKDIDEIYDLSKGERQRLSFDTDHFYFGYERDIARTVVEFFDEALQ